MSATPGTILTDALEEMFRDASEEYARARQSQRTKDTPAARRRVAEALTALDAILDKRNALRGERDVSWDGSGAHERQSGDGAPGAHQPAGAVRAL